jgi:hypothetical protein
MVRLTKLQKEANMIEFVKDIEEFLSIELLKHKIIPREWIDGDTEWRFSNTLHDFFELRVSCHNDKYLQENGLKNTTKERRRLWFCKSCWIYPSSMDESIKKLTKKQKEILETTGYLFYHKDRVLTKDWEFTDIRMILPKEEANPYEYVLK